MKNSKNLGGSSLISIPQKKKKKKKTPKVMKQGVCHIVCGLAIYIKKGILRQKKKNYGNSNISPCNKYHLQKIL